MDEGQQQIAELIERKDFSVARMGMSILIGFEFLSFGIDRLVIKSDKILELMTWSHAGQIILAMFVLVVAKSNPRLLVRLNPVCILPLFARYMAVLYGDLAVIAPELAILKSTLAASLVGVFIIFLLPNSRLLVPAIVTVLFSASTGTMLWNWPDGPSIALISSVGYFGALALKRSQIQGRRKSAEMEIAHRKLEVQAERGRFQLEMDLASAIQDSLRPADSLVVGPLKADFYMLKHGSVGGDWFAATARPDGSLIVLVVDATGKGLQAALVVHAVQSLWTAAKSDVNFDPERWIFRVNDVLNSMGRGTAHTVTLSLAEVRRDELKYWSAGHGPCYVVDLDHPEARPAMHFATGSVLGIGLSTEMSLKATVISLDPTRRQAIYLATDGVLVGSGRKDLRTIELLELGLPDRGAEALVASEIDDDKALVRVELAAVAAQRVG